MEVGCEDTSGTGVWYRVLEAAQGVEAFPVAEEHKGPIHLLVTDVVMPVISGRELAQHLVALHQEMKVLSTSGYTDNAIVYRHKRREASFLRNFFPIR